ncbi:hypothetical protein [Pseudoalteromonas sp. GB56]
MAQSNEGLEHARSYLKAVLTNDYGSILNFVDINKLTSKPEQSMWQNIAQLERSGTLSQQAKNELIENLSEQGLTEVDLKEITNSEYISYMLIEMFKLQEGGFTNLESLSLRHVSTEESNGVTHYIFLASGEIFIEESEQTKAVSDYRLVSIKNGNILIPSKVMFLTESFVGVFGR